MPAHLTHSLALALAFACAGPLCAQQSPPEERRSRGVEVFREVTPEARKAIDEGIEWLVANQLSQSGRWVSRPPRYQMSVTALAGLALLAHGETLDRGPHAAALRRAVEWVLENQQLSGRYPGLLCDQADISSENARPMHGHGFALLFLGQAYGTSHDVVLRERIAAAIRAGVTLSEQTMNKEGGWFYWPRADRGDEASVTVTQIQALRSARNAGFAVRTDVVERAVEYFKRSQEDTGGVRYQRERGPASAALTAAGIVVFQGAGKYYDDSIEKAYGYLRRNLKTEHSDDERWFFYTHLYAAQAMFQRGGPAWQSYFPRIRRELLDTRTADKHWDSNLGPAYATAIALLVLQLPDRFLPIYQR